MVLISCADSQRSTVGRGDTPVIKMAHYHSLDYEIPYGPLIISLYALMAQRWMHEYGWSPEKVAEVAVSQRYNASLHPNAQVRDLISVEDVVTSKPITEPLRLLNCSLISDGGAAMVVTTGERARALQQKPVYVTGVGNAYSYYFCWNLPDYTDYVRMLAATSADTAFAQAGVDRDDVDLAFVGDPADIATLVGLEGMGFAKPGEAVDFVQDGRIRVGGSLPVNTHGGCLSYAHPGAPGQHLHLIEAVRQLRGGCGDRQVQDAKVAAVHGNAGVRHVALHPDPVQRAPLAPPPTGGNTPCPWTWKSSRPAPTGPFPRPIHSPGRSGRPPSATSWSCRSATSAGPFATTLGPAVPSACPPKRPGPR